MREKSGLTTSQVGELLGKSGKTVNAWEHNHGQPDAEMLMKLCDIYNVKDILAEFRENKREDITNLSDEEIYLIKSYRNLSEQGQEYILQTIDIVKDKYKKRFIFFRFTKNRLKIKKSPTATNSREIV